MKSLVSLLILLTINIALTAQKNVATIDSISEWLSSYSDAEYLALLETIDSLREDKIALNNRYHQHQLGNFYYFTTQYDSAYNTYQRAAKLASAEGDQRSSNALKNNIVLA